MPRRNQIPLQARAAAGAELLRALPELVGDSDTSTASVSCNRGIRRHSGTRADDARETNHQRVMLARESVDVLDDVAAQAVGVRRLAADF